MFRGRSTKLITRTLLTGTLCLVFNSGFHRPISPADDSLALTPICNIQGDGFQSPYDGRSIITQGVVYADFDDTTARGFYIQDENCDGDVGTSDGVFVYLAERLDGRELAVAEGRCGGRGRGARRVGRRP